MLALPLVAVAAAVAFDWDHLFFWLYGLGLELPFRLWSALGMPVGRRLDYYGWADPNALGLTLIAVTDVIVSYVLAALVSIAWRALRRVRSSASSCS